MNATSLSSHKVRTAFVLVTLFISFTSNCIPTPPCIIPSSDNDNPSITLSLSDGTQTSKITDGEDLTVTGNEGQGYNVIASANDAGCLRHVQIFVDGGEFQDPTSVDVTGNESNPTDGFSAVGTLPPYVKGQDIKIWAVAEDYHGNTMQTGTVRLTTPVYYYKGQLHVHTNVLDAPPEQTAEIVETWYRDLGYTFVALTDHFATTSDPQVGCSQSNPSSCILHINGQEAGGRCGHHLIAIDDSQKDPIFPITEFEVCFLNQCQKVRDEVNSAGLLWCSCDEIEKSPFEDKEDELDCLRSRINTVTDRASIAFFGMHSLGSSSPSPHHDNTWTTEEIWQVGSYATGIEIINGNGLFDYRWDPALTIGNKIWGFGTDDCEDLVTTDGDGINLNDCNRSWIVVPSYLGPAQNYFTSDEKKDELRQDILQNIKAGNFYTVFRSPDITPNTAESTDFGPTLNVKFNGETVSVNTEESGSTFTTKKIDFLGQCGKTLSTASNTNQATYSPVNDALYVRAVVEQDRSGILYRAYTQPFYPTLSSGIELTVAGCNVVESASMIVDLGCADLHRTFNGEQLGSRVHFKIYLPIGSYNFQLKSSGYEDETGGFAVTNGFTNLGEIQLKLPGNNSCK